MWREREKRGVEGGWGRVVGWLVVAVTLVIATAAVEPTAASYAPLLSLNR